MTFTERVKSEQDLPRQTNFMLSGTEFSSDPRALQMASLSCSILKEISSEIDSRTPYKIKLGKHLSCSKVSCRT